MSLKQLDFGRLTDDEGHLGRPVPSGQVFVPGKIDLVGDNLVWEAAGPAKFVEVSKSTLNEFVRLWNEDSAAILRFARRWGVLAIVTLRESNPYYRPCSDEWLGGSDPIHAWRYFSRRASAVLNIAAALNQDRIGDLSDWRVIAAVDNTLGSYDAAGEQHRYGLGFFCSPSDDWTRVKGEEVERARVAVATEIETWLSFWRARRMDGLSDFAVRWISHRGAWELQVDYHGYLFAAIAFQLALCIVGADSLFTCSGCGGPYIREVKRPKPGSANYCPKCSRNGVAQRRATDAYREKKTEAVRLHTAGIPLRDIALKLNTQMSRVKKWCAEVAPESTSEPIASRAQSRKRARGRR